MDVRRTGETYLLQRGFFPPIHLLKRIYHSLTDLDLCGVTNGMKQGEKIHLIDFRSSPGGLFPILIPSFMREKPFILLVDDDENIRLLLGTVLSRYFRVAVQGNGMDAMAWLSDGHIPDLIIADLDMPEMDGFSLLQYLQVSGFFHSIPVLILSGNTDPGSRTRCEALGARAFIPKPFNPTDVVALVSAFTGPKAPLPA